ncbi:MAG: sigma-70 family RNA polymerase sigma factor [Methylobacter sp.]
MTQSALNIANPTVTQNVSEPVALAMEMEWARQDLLSLLLADDEASALLLEQCRLHLSNGLDISEIIREKNGNPIIVQDSDLVQLYCANTVQYLLSDSVDKSALLDLHFVSGFLIAVAESFINLIKLRHELIEYRTKLGRAALKLQKTRQEMIARNMGLVAYVAHKYKTTALGFDDLLQEGVVGLIKAVDRFDPERGYQFSTYAMPWIKQAISRLIIKQEKSVRLPVALAEKACVVFEAMRVTYLQTERWPSVEQLKKLCDLSEDEIKTIRSYYQATHSLDDRGDEDDGLALMERMQQQQFAQPLDELTGCNLSQYLNQVVATLPEKEAAILNMRFGLKNHAEMTLQAVADRLQVSRERVRQIQNDALKKLKNQFGCDLLLFLEANDSY